MELWFFYAVIGSLFIGINNYLIKIIAERKIDGLVITFFQGLIYLILGCIESYLRNEDFTLLFSMHPAIWYSIMIAIVVFLNLRFRVLALKYLSPSEYYIGYRIFLTAALALIGIIFLHEIVTEGQLFSLIIGSVAIYFLFEEDEQLRGSRNWKRALLFLFGSILAGVSIQVLGKMQGTAHFPFSLLLCIQGITMLPISLLFDVRGLRDFFLGKHIGRILLIVIPATICVYFAATFNLYAYESGGSVSVVTKIYAYSLFVPILLSVFFGQEKLSYKKTIAIILTIVSLYYMI